MRTSIYVDGFNLYYRAVKQTPYRWLDIDALSRALVGNHQIGRIRYFTARVKGRANNPHQAQRQQIYIRALETIPHLEIHYGNFLSKPKHLPLVSALPNIKTVEVLNTEEKGSDVNLASFLLLDGFKDDYDSALVISNDSDLQEPIRMVRQELGKKVGVVITDHRAKRSALRADFYRRIRKGNLRACQFPETMMDTHGTIKRPSKWS